MGPALHIAVEGLPSPQRRALELRVVQQLSYDEVAGRLGCSQNAARLRVSRALRTLTLTLGSAGRERSRSPGGDEPRVRGRGPGMAVSSIPRASPPRRRARPHGPADPRLARPALLEVGGRRAARARRRHPPLPPAARRPRADLGEGADPDAARDGARRPRRPPRAPRGPAARRVRADAAGRQPGRAAEGARRVVAGARQAGRGGARALRRAAAPANARRHEARAGA